MNLTKLFEAQRALDAHIINQHPNLRENESNLDWKVLALLVELGECANEWHGFKKWSNDQRPRTFKRENCPDCYEKGFYRGNPPVDEHKGVHGLGNHWYDCPKCSGFLVVDTNPLLEEYVDCLHFLLSIGIELKFTKLLPCKEPSEKEIIDLFNLLFEHISFLREKECHEIAFYSMVFKEFITLGNLLGFSWNEVEQAYFDKNEINHQRQENGY